MISNNSLTEKEKSMVRMCKDVIKYCRILSIEFLPPELVKTLVGLIREYKKFCHEASNSEKPYVANLGKKAINTINNNKFLQENKQYTYIK